LCVLYVRILVCLVCDTILVSLVCEKFIVMYLRILTFIFCVQEFLNSYLVSLQECVCVWEEMCVCVSLQECVCVCEERCVCVSLHQCVCVWGKMCVCVSLQECVCVWEEMCVCVSLHQCVCVYEEMCVCVFLHQCECVCEEMCVCVSLSILFRFDIYYFSACFLFLLFMYVCVLFMCVCVSVLTHDMNVGIVFLRGRYFFYLIFFIFLPASFLFCLCMFEKKQSFVYVCLCERANTRYACRYCSCHMYEWVITFISVTWSWVLTPDVHVTCMNGSSHSYMVLALKVMTDGVSQVLCNEC